MPQGAKAAGSAPDPWLCDGRKAHDGGYRRDQCPYPDGSADAVEWQRQWQEGQASDRRAEAKVFGACRRLR